MAPLDGKCDPVRPEMNQPNIQTDLDRAKHATTIPKSEADIIATGNNRSSRTPEYGPPSTHAYPVNTASMTTGSNGSRRRDPPIQEKMGCAPMSMNVAGAQANMMEYGANRPSEKSRGQTSDRM